MNFTGKERDPETASTPGGTNGLDNFGARHFTSNFGRFMTPDWSARPTTVPYAVFGDPQSLSLYGYVRNDPVSRADLDGHIAPNVKCNNDQKTCQVALEATLNLEKKMFHAAAAAGISVPGPIGKISAVVFAATMPSAKAEQMKANKEQGKAFEQEVKPQLESKQKGVVEQLTVKTERSKNKSGFRRQE